MRENLTSQEPSLFDASPLPDTASASQSAAAPQSAGSLSAARSRTHKVTVTAMLSAVAFILMFIEFPIPSLIPSFVKMDVSDLPELLAAYR